MRANRLTSASSLLSGAQFRRDLLARHLFLRSLMWLAKLDAQVGTVSATTWPFLILNGLSSVKTCLRP
ncbi:MAG: hypothetical protein AABM66_05735, partial [Actinomycetota bacterium]